MPLSDLTSLSQIKDYAKVVSKRDRLPHQKALDAVSRLAGFSNFDAARKASERTRFEAKKEETVTITGACQVAPKASSRNYPGGECLYRSSTLPTFHDGNPEEASSPSV
ncbi:hypothetical protein [Sphingobium yanoikuyae]|jgi:hypothetical protein|uniref:hypothetical protein n=1 Tax=Sphingobium yanoikuyae TaxID=13690 RepID=UPI00241CB5F6|nr:hypothetical protein [Sphingobium yanoikuyae]